MVPHPDDHAFVVRLYANQEGELRGTITHVLSHRRRRLKRPEDVLAFLAPYLDALNVRMSLQSRLLLRLTSRQGPPSGPLAARDP